MKAMCVYVPARLICHRKPTVSFHLIRWVGLNLWPAAVKILDNLQAEEAGLDVHAAAPMLPLGHPQRPDVVFFPHLE